MKCSSLFREQEVRCKAIHLVGLVGTQLLAAINSPYGQKCLLILHEEKRNSHQHVTHSAYAMCDLMCHFLERHCAMSSLPLLGPDTISPSGQIQLQT